jgi:hypothetical protein
MAAEATERRIDVGSLAGAVFGDVSARLSQFVVQAFRWAEEDGRELDDHQKEQVLRALFASFDGLEASIVKTLISDLESSGVETWGLSSSLEDLVRKSH